MELNEKTIRQIIEDSSKAYANIDLDKVEAEAFDDVDFFLETENDYDEFDERAKTKGSGYLSIKYKDFTEKLDGLDEGMYLIAAESNVGKSAVMLELISDLASNPENKLFGMYYTLDDTKGDIIPRVIAADQSIPIAICSKPMRYQKMIDNGEAHSSTYAMQLEKRQEGLEKLKQRSREFKIEDGNKIKNADDLFKHMKKVQAFVKSIDPEMNIVVAIDALDDIRFKGNNNMTTTERHALIACTVKEWSTELHIPIFGTRHLKKLGANRRPTLDDLKDSNEYVYESSAVWLLHSDVGRNKQGAEIYYQEDNNPTKLPVIEVNWAKNKKSSFKGDTYFHFRPEYSKVTECTQQECMRYSTLIYSNM